MTIKEKARNETKFLNRGEKIMYSQYFIKGALWVLSEIENFEDIEKIKEKIKNLRK